MLTDAEKEWRKGIASGIGAYLWWGFFPIYIKLVIHVPVLEIVCHRVAWCFALLLILMTVTRRWKALFGALRDRRVLLLLLGSTFVICFNWLGMVQAVAIDQIRQSSLGYFMNPLVSVFFGFAFLGERLRRVQLIAILLAVTGVIIQTLLVGIFPWIAIMIAISFGLYGLFRKLANVDSMAGLTFETGLLAPLVILYMVSLGTESAFVSNSTSDRILLIIAGPVTCVPLLLFTAMARRVKLATVGFLQYMTPSLHLLLAVTFYGESFTTGHAVSFAMIWVALGLYSFDLWRIHRNGGGRGISST